MSTVKVKNLVIGEGIPKICVPIVSKTEEDILIVAKAITDSNADLVEWRVDWFSDVNDLEKVKELTKQLSNVLGDMPLLLTLRTANEGGEHSIDTEGYFYFLKEVVKAGFVDLIDIEILRCKKEVEDFVKYAHAYGVKVVGSNHDFEKTPPKDEIISTLIKMQTLGVDIPKIAVMPTNRTDVLTLLEATLIMNEQFADRPIITMSMGKMGSISRVVGEMFGSAITFGTLGQSSAPGQMTVEDLTEMLRFFEKYK